MSASSGSLPAISAEQQAADDRKQQKFWMYFCFSVGLAVCSLFDISSIMNLFTPSEYYKDKKKLLIGETSLFSVLVITFITLIILTSKDII